MWKNKSELFVFRFWFFVFFFGSFSDEVCVCRCCRLYEYNGHFVNGPISRAVFWAEILCCSACVEKQKSAYNKQMDWPFKWIYNSDVSARGQKSPCQSCRLCRRMHTVDMIKQRQQNQSSDRLISASADSMHNRSNGQNEAETKCIRNDCLPVPQQSSIAPGLDAILKHTHYKCNRIGIMNNVERRTLSPHALHTHTPVRGPHTHTLNNSAVILFLRESLKPQIEMEYLLK